MIALINDDNLPIANRLGLCNREAQNECDSAAPLSAMMTLT
jgi:hypothetical protein